MDDDMKWYFISFAVIFLGLFIMTSLEEKYEKDIIVACYEAGKLDCDKINK